MSFLVVVVVVVVGLLVPNPLNNVPRIPSWISPMDLRPDVRIVTTYLTNLICLQGLGEIGANNAGPVDRNLEAPNFIGVLSQVHAQAFISLPCGGQAVEDSQLAPPQVRDCIWAVMSHVLPTNLSLAWNPAAMKANFTNDCRWNLLLILMIKSWMKCRTVVYLCRVA